VRGRRTQECGTYLYGRRCVVRSAGMASRSCLCLSNRQWELGKGGGDPQGWVGVVSDFVVATT